MDTIRHTKPTIIIMCHAQSDIDVIQPCLYGLEEEGIPYAIVVKDTHGGTGLYGGHELSGLDDIGLACEAAQASSLGVGIGVNVTHMTLTHKTIPSQQYVYRLAQYGTYPHSMRIIGTNAARMVKGTPFVFDTHLETSL